ncbi:MAG: type II toxin-antitoxin system RelE/ParE family toxin [Syntrophothermus sp.]|uniref:type II toxin-antitoxin system RelE family toxin n=1 Tax=Syntrophothermus sp. TaxID=2736299 RepID=UPI0025810595|nr:type II toxin-antitoxin system RelE/ParE family toxin [Syntrophothermus sp.]NSW83179.1 type II toxin-antitoxin system RelE/ParE family toxin [Syntrophothermus sp.]
MQFGGQRFRVELSRKARNYYERLDADTAARLDEAFEAMEENPWSGDIRPVKGKPGTWRRREGDLRIIYRVDKQTRVVTVTLILPRGDVYKH